MFNNYKTTTSKFKTHFLKPFIVLMWKYVKIQRYRYGHTFWELFGSLILFIIIFLLHQINVSNSGNIIDTNKSDKLMETQDSLVRVFYEPFNSFTQNVMKEAETYLNQNSYSKQQWEFQSIGFPLNFHDDFFNTSDGIAHVKFKNKGSFTTDLDYSISVLCDVAKSNLDVAFHGVLRTSAPREMAPPYLGYLQWAIDKSYIEKLASKDIDQVIMLSAIPVVMKDELITLHKFLIICNILGPLPYFLAFASKLVEERRSGMKELMRQAGISALVRRCAYYVEALIASILYAFVVTVLLKVSDQPILRKSNSFIIGFTIALHFVSTMCLAFVTAILCQNIKYADCLACIIYLLPFILEFLWYSYNEYTFLFYYLLPHAPIYLFWDEVFHLEGIGEGSDFSNIFKSHCNHYMVSWVWMAFVVQQVITITLAWYFDLVSPGYYGVSKKCYFFVQKRYWCPINKRKIIKLPAYLLVKKNESHFQKVPKNVEIAVQVLNVSKVFMKTNPKINVIALDSVTFNCCRGEVTMLLGANGAGKSTLLLIVAGMLSVTDGHVFVSGFEVGTTIVERRHSLRICMQKDMCFQYLTIKENLIFFNKLKKNKELFTVEYLLKKLKLLEMSDHLAHHLSPGNMKCLQVACVLAGDADVLLLDEPTTGMEIEVRLRLWDMLMILRGNKTILMATSCLEEANALGDRIVLLDNGVLRCYGSPMFIKNVIGTSFTLSIIIKNSARLYDLKELVDRTIPDLKCHIDDMTRIVFSLPTREFNNFPELFRTLEEQRDHLGIVLMDVGMFMEEVFEKFIDTDTEQESKSIRKAREDTVYCRTRTKGCKLRIIQTAMLILRFFDNILLQRGLFLTLRFLVPIFCMINVTLSSNYSLRIGKMFHGNMPMITSQIAKLVYNVSPYSRRGLFHDDVMKFPGVETVYSQNIDKEFASPGYSKKEIVGFEITDDYIRIIHPIDPQLTTQTINMFSNMFMSMYLPTHNNTIWTSYKPIGRQRRPARVKEVKSSYLCLRWSSWVTFLSMFPIAPTIILCIWERKFGIRDNHFMAGCTPIIHWNARLIAHMAIFMVVVVIPLLIICVFLDFDRTFLQPKFMGSVLSMLLMFGLAFHTYLYLFSFHLHENLALCQIYISSLFFGVVLPVLISVLEVFAEKIIYFSILYYIFEAIARLCPLYALGVGLARLTLRARLNAFCVINKSKCPHLKFDDEFFDVEVCCKSTYEPFPYLNSVETGLYDLLTLFIQFVVCWTLVILLEYKILQSIHEKILFRRYKQLRETVLDTSSVQRERDLVQTALEEKNFIENVFLVNNVHKYYTDTEFTKKKKYVCYSVQGVTFATKLGQCLAILGTSLAGKRALVSMVAGQRVMTRGHACIQGTFLRRNRMKYIHKICLSSSTGGMDDFMTGLDNLVFVAKLRGYSQKMAYFLAYKALTLMGLSNNKVAVSEYSSGCLRRLSLCNVLVLSPPVAFLDEPTKEIDASSKSLVAKAMQHLKREPAAIILTEKSLDWKLMQPVCDRIAIMSKGHFAVIGKADEVLDSIGKGYMARIKLKMVTAYRRERYSITAEDESDTESEDDVSGPSFRTPKSYIFAQTLIDFKADFLKTFQSSRLFSEHLCMMFFYIDDQDKSQRYSSMFKKLQELQEKYNDLIEDYILSYTTVEDFFWALQYKKVPTLQNTSVSAAFET